MKRQSERKRRLRKQPKSRRMQASAVSSASMPAPAPPMPRTARQRRQRNSRLWLRTPVKMARSLILTSRWVSLALFLLTLYALNVVAQSDRFYLNAIPVEGAKAIPPEEVIKASGLAGVHVFSADPSRAAARIAQTPGVITATVSLRWPNQVVVRIGEDSPVAVWEEGGQTYWVDATGRLIPAHGVTPGLLYIRSEVSLPPQPAGEGEGEADEPFVPQFVPAEVLAGALQLRELRPNIAELSYRPSGGLSYADGRGWRAYFGAGSDMAQKLVVYETLVDQLLQRGLQPVYISVSNAKKPFYLAPGG